MQLFIDFFCKMPWYYKNQINENNKPIFFKKSNQFRNSNSVRFIITVVQHCFAFRRFLLLFCIYLCFSISISFLNVHFAFISNFVYQPDRSPDAMERNSRLRLKMDTFFLFVCSVELQLCLSIMIYKKNFNTILSNMITCTTNNINDLKSRIKIYIYHEITNKRIVYFFS